MIFALAEAWGGLTLAHYTDWPTSFWITALSGMVFFGAATAIRGLAERPSSGASRHLLPQAGEGIRPLSRLRERAGGEGEPE